jgi:hypothetical protein
VISDGLQDGRESLQFPIVLGTGHPGSISGIPRFFVQRGNEEGFLWILSCLMLAEGLLIFIQLIFMELFLIVCRSPKQLVGAAAHILKLVMNLLHVQVDHEVCVHCRVIWLTFLKIQNDDAGSVASLPGSKTSYFASLPEPFIPPIQKEIPNFHTLN